MYAGFSAHLFFGGCDEFRWRHAIKIFLVSVVVIEVHVCIDCFPQGFIVLKMIGVIHFRFQDAPESLHWGVVKTAPYTGHTLAYTGPFHNFLKRAAGVLDAPVTMQQRLCVRIFLECLLEGIQYQRSIIAAAQGEWNDIPPVQIQNSAQIRLTARAIFEFRHIGHPFLFCRSDENSLFRIFSAAYSVGVFFLYRRFFFLHADRKPSTHMSR